MNFGGSMKKRFIHKFAIKFILGSIRSKVISQGLSKIMNHHLIKGNW